MYPDRFMKFKWKSVMVSSLYFSSFSLYFFFLALDHFSLKYLHGVRGLWRIHQLCPSNSDDHFFSGCIQRTFRGGQPCHIWSRNRDFKGLRPWIGPQWMCVQRLHLNDAHALDPSTLLIGLYHNMHNPNPSLHISCCGLISNVFTWIGLVTDNLFIRPSREGSHSLYVFILLINMEDNNVWDSMTNFSWLGWTLGQRLFGKTVCGVPYRNISTLCKHLWVQSIHDKQDECIGSCWYSSLKCNRCIFSPSFLFVCAALCLSFPLSEIIN